MTRTASRTELTGGNAWEQALHSHLMAHVDNEGEQLDAYQRAAVESHSPAFRYLASVIVADERRHHAIFEDLARTLRTEVDHGREEFAVPRLGQWGFEREHILTLTNDLLAQERKDAVELQDLESELSPVKDTTMWPLLVRLMQADTDKHISILEFIKEQAARTWDASEGTWSGIEHAGASAP